MNNLIAIPKIAQWQKLKMLVLDSVSSPITKRVYNMALDEFYCWFQQAPRPGFTKATVSAWRVSLEERRLGSSSIIIRMSAIRKLAGEAADNGLLAPELAQGISRVKSVKSTGIRVGNWLSQKQAQALLSAPDISTVRGLRDRAILAVLLGCGLRRSEVAAITFSHVQQGAGQGHTFTASNNGVLVWRGLWSRDYQLVWRDRTGKQTGVEGPLVKQSSDGQEPRLSPDGRQFAFKRDNAIWVSDTARYVPVKLGNGQVPIWSPDGRRVAFAGGALLVMAANGVGDSQKLVDGVNIPTDWSPDGRFLLFFRRSEKTRSDIWALPMEGGHNPYPLINSAGEDLLARFSPDGGWIAYASDESGTQEVYIRSFTGDGHIGPDRERISSSGGSQAIWRKDGKELFYLSPKGEIMAVPVNRSGARLEFGTPAALFKTVAPIPGRTLGTYDVTSDGQRFLLGEFVGESANAIPTVILNWPGILPR